MMTGQKVCFAPCHAAHQWDGVTVQVAELEQYGLWLLMLQDGRL